MCAAISLRNGGLAKTSHGGHVNHLGLGGLLVAIVEGAPIQLVVDQFFGHVRVTDRDRWAVRFSPDGLSPLLEEVRVAVCPIKD